MIIVAEEKFAEADGAGLEKFAGVAEHIGFSGPFHGKFLDQRLVGSGVVKPEMRLTPLVPQNPFVKWYFFRLR